MAPYFFPHTLPILNYFKMEDWQRQLIVANLPQLCEFTDCNIHFLVILQSRKVLSKLDVETIVL